MVGEGEGGGGNMRGGIGCHELCNGVKGREEGKEARGKGGKRSEGRK